MKFVVSLLIACLFLAAPAFGTSAKFSCGSDLTAFDGIAIEFDDESDNSCAFVLVLKEDSDSDNIKVHIDSDEYCFFSAEVSEGDEFDVLVVSISQAACDFSPASSIFAPANTKEARGTTDFTITITVPGGCALSNIDEIFDAIIDGGGCIDCADEATIRACLEGTTTTEEPTTTTEEATTEPTTEATTEATTSAASSTTDLTTTSTVTTTVTTTQTTSTGSAPE
eukprot:CAMPEP_0174249826 /NCGR_PEP_ID=MMETSP0439-20130205/158_1 /TAXON_ID=0 /ORGANISM="Stereomyxa ramosa, Strain Chinc5" /LENGTH=224 /DNA_ID=CAMNT_0015329739 /DNA_START=49 /DNA_END=723 /DNA_ORIENTATION=+